ncbi:MAG: carbon-nitrogen hydrolase family protein [Beijerinckiaceae bacterium]|nr:carbon-nitrogen hydrolase family protein [Beijerinckiaceae bacterium]
MKIALIQMNSTDDKSANLAQAARLIEAAVAAEKPDWISLPEVFDFMGGSRADKAAAAEAFPDGDAYRLMSDLARRHGVHIHAGSMLEKIPGEDRLGNTTVAFDRTGAEVARYRKIHMFDVTTPDGQDYRESATMKPGVDVVTYECEGVTVGCAICYDLRFPALFQALMSRGAQLIALPSAFTMQTGKDHWDVLCRARAIETQTYFAAAAQTGQFRQGGETRSTYGHSLIADPWGLVIAKASDGPGFVTARIELDRLARVRSQIPVAQHRVSLT